MSDRTFVKEFFRYCAVAILLVVSVTSTLRAEDLIGELWRYQVADETILHHVAEETGVGFVELRAANPGVDPWIFENGQRLLIPDRHILPQVRPPGLVINLGDMRLYYLSDNGTDVRSWPIGIGHIHRTTPLGQTRVTELRVKPTWRPNKNMRRANPDLPSTVPPGPDNPLGEYAIRIGWKEYAIHGTNKPSGVGRRVSSGCIRLYPDDIKELFPLARLGMHVEIIDEPVKLGWHKGALYLEAHPTGTQADQIETQGRFDVAPIKMSALRGRIRSMAAKRHALTVNWAAVTSVIAQRRGIPLKISN